MYGLIFEDTHAQFFRVAFRIMDDYRDIFTNKPALFSNQVRPLVDIRLIGFRIDVKRNTRKRPSGNNKIENNRPI